jgi:hypothetical protein
MHQNDDHDDNHDDIDDNYFGQVFLISSTKAATG